jgi:hypothetical protein
MHFEHQGKRYGLIRARDLERDGMGLELQAEGKTAAAVFYSDASGNFTISVFVESLPLAVIERLISEARVLLPPVTKSSVD